MSRTRAHQHYDSTWKPTPRRPGFVLPPWAQRVVITDELVLRYMRLFRSLHWFHGVRREIPDREDFDADVRLWFVLYAKAYDASFKIPFHAYIKAKMHMRVVWLGKQYIDHVSHCEPVGDLRFFERPDPEDFTLDVCARLTERALWAFLYYKVASRDRQAYVRRYLRDDSSINTRRPDRLGDRMKGYRRLTQRFGIGRSRVCQLRDRANARLAPILAQLRVDA